MQWFFANYMYGLALDRTNVAMVNTLSATSGVFVMILVGIPFLTMSEGDKFTIPRCLVTLLRSVPRPLTLDPRSGATPL